MATLAEELKELQQPYVTDMPEDVLRKIADITRELIAGSIAENALGIGDLFPEFELVNLTGDAVSLEELLFKKNALVLNFYHGEWCPFCNYEINAYHQVMPMIRALNARFVGISPQLPDHWFSQKERRKLLFDVLYDQSNNLARKLGIVCELKGALKEIYTEFGYDIPLSNGNDSWELPISATYIIKHNRRIGQFFVDADYVHRTDPQQVIRFLELMKHENKQFSSALFRTKGI